MRPNRTSHATKVGEQLRGSAITEVFGVVRKSRKVYEDERSSEPHI
jgi:hypothetical protein